MNTALVGRIRDSQFVVPAIFIAASIALVFVTNWLDAKLGEGGLPFLVPATASSARDMLATIAASIITVAALVFSLMALTIQMAASQYSPRVIQGFLKDRFQQVVLGVVIGTFTFALVGLASLGDPMDEARANWTATVGVVLGVGSALLIVAYIDRVTRRIRVDDTIKRIAKQTQDAFRQMPRFESIKTERSWELADQTESMAVRANADGWVKSINLTVLADALSPGAVARVEQLSGTYATAGTRLVTIWQEAGLDTIDEGVVRAAFSIGGTRSIDGHDPGFGIRQLVDIALRALSPGINDPATAADVVRHLAGPIRVAFLETDIHRTYLHHNGTRLVQPTVLQPADYVHLAYAEIRLTASEQPTVLAALAGSLTALYDALEAEGINAIAISHQLDLVHTTVETSPLDETDTKPILKEFKTK